MGDRFYRDKMEKLMSDLFRKKRQMFLDDIPTIDFVNSLEKIRPPTRGRIFALQRQNGDNDANIILLDYLQRQDEYWLIYLKVAEKIDECKRTADLIKDVLSANPSTSSNTTRSPIQEQVSPITGVPSRVISEQEKKELKVSPGYIQIEQTEIHQPTEEGEASGNAEFSSKSQLLTLCQSHDESRVTDDTANVEMTTKLNDNDKNRNRNPSGNRKPTGEKQISLDHQPYNDEDNGSYVVSDSELDSAYNLPLDEVVSPEIDSLKLEKKNNMEPAQIENNRQLDGAHKIHKNDTFTFGSVEQSKNPLASASNTSVGDRTMVCEPFHGNDDMSEEYGPNNQELAKKYAEGHSETRIKVGDHNSIELAQTENNIQLDDTYKIHKNDTFTFGSAEQSKNPLALASNTSVGDCTMVCEPFHGNDDMSEEYCPNNQELAKKYTESHSETQVKVRKDNNIEPAQIKNKIQLDGASKIHGNDTSTFGNVEQSKNPLASASNTSVGDHTMVCEPFCDNSGISEEFGPNNQELAKKYTEGCSETQVKVKDDNERNKKSPKPGPLYENCLIINASNVQLHTTKSNMNVNKHPQQLTNTTNQQVIDMTGGNQNGTASLQIPEGYAFSELMQNESRFNIQGDEDLSQVLPSQATNTTNQQVIDMTGGNQNGTASLQIPEGYAFSESMQNESRFNIQGDEDLSQVLPSQATNTTNQQVIDMTGGNQNGTASLQIPEGYAFSELMQNESRFNIQGDEDLSQVLPSQARPQMTAEASIEENAEYGAGSSENPHTICDNSVSSPDANSNSDQSMAAFENTAGAEATQTVTVSGGNEHLNSDSAQSSGRGSNVTQETSSFSWRDAFQFCTTGILRWSGFDLGFKN